MPRIYASNNDPCDYCQKCYPDEGSVTWHRLMNSGDNRGNCFEPDAEHPPYDEMNYDCQACGKPLTSKDDYLPHGWQPER